MAAVRAGGPVGREAAAGTLPRAARRPAGAARCRVRPQRPGEARHDRPRRRARHARGHAPGHRGRRRACSGPGRPSASCRDTQDNALWEEFRRNCDAVFERSSQEWAAHGAALEANQARATSLCEELERMAGLTGESLLSGDQAAGRTVQRVRVTRVAAGVRARPAPAVQSCDRPLRRSHARAPRGSRAPRLDRPVCGRRPGPRLRARAPRSASRRRNARHCGNPQRRRSQASSMRRRGRARCSNSSWRRSPPARSAPTSRPTKRHCGCCASARS